MVFWIILSGFLFVSFVPFLNYDTGIRCIKAPCPSVKNGSLLAYAILSQLTIYKVKYPTLVIGILLSIVLAWIILRTIRLTNSQKQDM